ncbi:MAG: FAD-dependent oxidoreductase [Traorella sp.]
MNCWIKERMHPLKKLDQDIECEVLIVGAGMSGLLCAYELHKYTNNIVMIESDEICYGASGRSTGKLSSHHGLNYHKIYDIHGKEKTRLYYEENQQAIHEIKKIIDEYDIHCLYQEKESIIGCKTKEQIKTIQKEINTYTNCEIPYEIIKENENMLLGTKFKHQASFDPYQFCIQLAEKLDIEIYENTPMSHIHDHVVTSKNYQIKYQKCILATQVLPFQFKFFYTLMKPKISFLASLTPSTHSTEMILIEDKITKTTNDFEKFMIRGGYDQDIYQDKNKKWQQFKSRLVLEYPKHQIQSTWSSQDYEVFDYLPIVDEVEDFIVITGFNKWGNTNAYVASRVVGDIYLNKQTKRKELFRINRPSLIFNKKILSENIQVLKSLLLSKKQQDTLCIPLPDEALSFNFDNHPYGIYRQNDTLYIVDILCPHLGCTLKFNNYEKRWECPCHGSAFSIKGEIIKGPANVNIHHSICEINELKDDFK